MSRVSVSLKKVRSTASSSGSDISTEATTSSSPSAHNPSGSPITTNQEEEFEEESDYGDDDIGPSDSASRPRGAPKPSLQIQTRRLPSTTRDSSRRRVPVSDPPHSNHPHHYPSRERHVDLVEEHTPRHRHHLPHHPHYQRPPRQRRRPPPPIRPPSQHLRQPEEEDFQEHLQEHDEMSHHYYYEEERPPPHPRRQHRHSEPFPLAPEHLQQGHYNPFIEQQYPLMDPRYYVTQHAAGQISPVGQIAPAQIGYFDPRMQQMPTTQMIPFNYYQTFASPQQAPAAAAPAAPSDDEEANKRFGQLTKMLEDTQQSIVDQEKARLQRKKAKEEEAINKAEQAKKAAAEKQAEDNFQKLTKLMAEYEKTRTEREEKAETARVEREKEREAKLETERKAKAAALAEEEKKKKAAEALAAAEKKGKEEAQAKAKEELEKSKAAHEKALKEATDAANKAKEAEEAAKKEAAALKPADDDKQPPIQFTDALGRKFRFPWKICKTWRGMDDLIKQAFEHVEPIGKAVQAGQFDLIDSSGEFLLPKVWDTMIKPDASITMKMWPVKKEAPPAPPAPPVPSLFPPGGAPPLRPPANPPYQSLWSRKEKPSRRGKTHYVVVPQGPPAGAGPARPPAPARPAAAAGPIPVPPVAPVPHAAPPGGGGAVPAMSSGQAAAMMAGGAMPPGAGAPPARSPSISSKRRSQVNPLLQWVGGRR